MLTISSDARKGLVGVIVDETAVSRVGDNLPLLYRGYEVQDLAAHCTFAQVAYLILYGELPSQTQLEAFRGKERSRRDLSDALIGVIRRFPATADPMERLRTAVSYLGMEDPQANDCSPPANLEKAIQLMAHVPTIIATDYRCRQGLEPIAPRRDLGFAANFFQMCFGEVPPRALLRSFELSLILYADLGFTPSTFTARVVASSLSDIYSAVTAALGALKGPLHGGANAAVMRMLLDIGEPARAQAWIDQGLAERRNIPGFGHRIFRSGDPRGAMMCSALSDLAQRRDGQRWLAIQEILAKTLRERRQLYPNVDYFTGPAYYLMGFDIDLFTSIFAMARMAGWCAHIMEQWAANKLIRPIGAYTGAAQRVVVE